MSNILLHLLSFILPLIHSNFLNYFWFNFEPLVNWNFEFSKVIFFDMISSFVIISFLIEKILKKESIKIVYWKILFLILLVSIISTIFSISPFISLFWNNIKAHWLVMLINLLGIFIVLTNKDKEFLLRLLKTSFLSLFVVLIIWIKEYLLPSLDYEISLNKAISTFWNNQFLALYLLLFLPLITDKSKKIVNLIKDKKIFTIIFSLLFLILFIALFFLTKSFIWISILSIYLIFLLLWKKKWVIFSFIFLVIWLFLIYFYLPEKLHSLLSRFYIWQNTLSIIWSDIKTLLLWNWFETLDLVFSKEKNPYLYIFENFWFIADRSHNLWLDIFYSSWLLGLALSLYIWFIILKNKKLFPVLIIFFAFTFLNFASIVHYFILILFFAIYLEKWKNDIFKFKWKWINIAFLISLVLYLVFCILFYFKFFIAEVNYKNWNLWKSISYFRYPTYFIENWDYINWLKYYKIKPDIYYKNLILKSKSSLINNCSEYVKIYNLAESYIWCWQLLEKENYKKESQIFYKKWLSLLPDLWNNNSKYYNNFFVKHTINWNRFYNEKYSNIKEILLKIYNQ